MCLGASRVTVVDTGTERLAEEGVPDQGAEEMACREEVSRSATDLRTRPDLSQWGRVPPLAYLECSSLSWAWMPLS